MQDILPGSVTQPEELPAQCHRLTGLETHNDLLGVPDLRGGAGAFHRHRRVFLFGVKPRAQPAPVARIPQYRQRFLAARPKGFAFGDGRQRNVTDWQAPGEGDRSLGAEAEQGRAVCGGLEQLLRG